MTGTGAALLAAVEDTEYGKAAPFGLFVTLALAVAVVFLVRSMVKHLRRVPPTFDPAKPTEPPAGEGPGEATTRHTTEPPAAPPTG